MSTPHRWLIDVIGVSKLAQITITCPQFLSYQRLTHCATCDPVRLACLLPSYPQWLMRCLCQSNGTFYSFMALIQRKFHLLVEVGLSPGRQPPSNYQSPVPPHYSQRKICAYGDRWRNTATSHSVIISLYTLTIGKAFESQREKVDFWFIPSLSAVRATAWGWPVLSQQPTRDTGIYAARTACNWRLSFLTCCSVGSHLVWSFLANPRVSGRQLHTHTQTHTSRLFLDLEPVSFFSDRSTDGQCRSAITHGKSETTQARFLAR